ncbi:C69 family dipeptidase [Saccharopolyspora phatthalungensis]|uniref:Dipeptidase n=1 Tax=Saccharopolyspora phatthalungensis TaxID=664693 RepID=A0A840QI93_9PSEU|nr:C69 family dipeptidase [Saccharopolyspora phatthalungensis]MBB5159957.1 secernin [Saccharopolyspora phatthalungensis]
MPDVTPNGHVLVGKNSDRPVSDAQPLCFYPQRRPTAGDKLALAYVEIDDAASYAHVGGSPYWCWGHELGLNEWGVVVGNEALFTRDWAAGVAMDRAGAPVDPGVLGMELVRLGLERGRTAEEAMTVICALVEQYGQWGAAVPGSPSRSGAYDNSFVIADPHEAWIVETSGRQWVARRVREGTWAISNQATIRTQWDRASEDLVAHAVGAGWWNAGQEGEFDFARAYTDPGTPLQVSHIRLQRSRQLLREISAKGGVDVEGAKRILRDHYEDTFLDGPYFNAALPDFLSLCMHSHPSGFTWGNTASSAVFVLPAGDEPLPYLWWTPVTPCTGVYLPVFVGAGRVPAAFATAGSAGRLPRCPVDAPEDTFDEGSYWWRFRLLLDRVKGDESGGMFAERQPIVRSAFDELERRWAKELPQIQDEALRVRRDRGDAAMAETLAAFTDSCASQAWQAAEELIAGFGG